jgi:hypothetical protein
MGADTHAIATSKKKHMAVTHPERQTVSNYPIPLLGLFHMTAVHLLTPEEEDKDGEKRASEGSGRRAELRKLAEQHTEARSHLFSLVRACQGVQNLS